MFLRVQPALPQLTASCCSESGTGQGRFYPELSALCLASGLCHSLHFVCVTVFILSASQSSFCLRHSPHFVCVTVLILSVSESSFCLCQSSSCLCHCLHFVCATVLILSVSQSSSCLCHSLYLLCVSLNLVCVTVFILFPSQSSTCLCVCFTVFLFLTLRHSCGLQGQRSKASLLGTGRHKH